MISSSFDNMPHFKTNDRNDFSTLFLTYCLSTKWCFFFDTFFDLLPFDQTTLLYNVQKRFLWINWHYPTTKHFFRKCPYILNIKRFRKYQVLIKSNLFLHLCAILKIWQRAVLLKDKWSKVIAVKKNLGTKLSSFGNFNFDESVTFCTLCWNTSGLLAWGTQTFVHPFVFYCWSLVALVGGWGLEAFSLEVPWQGRWRRCQTYPKWVTYHHWHPISTTPVARITAHATVPGKLKKFKKVPPKKFWS